MKPLIEMNYPGLRRIISGGQCGVDRGALEAAKAWPLSTSGWAPKGWRTWYGPDPSLASFGMVEHHSANYPPRTEANVVDSDGTLILGRNPDSPGSALTKQLTTKRAKPCLTISFPLKDEAVTAVRIAEWIVMNNIQTLNVAGNRDLEGSYHRDTTEVLITSVLMELEMMGMLIKL